MVPWKILSGYLQGLGGYPGFHLIGGAGVPECLQHRTTTPPRGSSPGPPTLPPSFSHKKGGLAMSGCVCQSPSPSLCPTTGTCLLPTMGACTGVLAHGHTQSLGPTVSSCNEYVAIDRVNLDQLKEGRILAHSHLRSNDPLPQCPARRGVQSVHMYACLPHDRYG